MPSLRRQRRDLQLRGGRRDDKAARFAHATTAKKNEQLDITKSVLHRMQHGSDAEAMELSARLRTRASLRELANALKGYFSEMHVQQDCEQSRNEQKGAQANNVLPSARDVPPESDLFHGTHLHPRNDLPNFNYATLRAIVLHLRRMSLCENRNHMATSSLAICFAPSLMGTHTCSQLADAGLQSRVLDTILIHAMTIFDED